MSEDINVGAISEALNNKADRDMANTIPPYVVSRTANSLGGMTEIWSDGYCVQTGIKSVTGSNDPLTINLAVSYRDTNYFVFLTKKSASTGNPNAATIQDFAIYQYNTNSFVLPRGYNGPVRWKAEGYIR